jgi:hydrogenase nickel incorporation protein HypA/HybF
MHELPITENIIKMTTEAAAEANATRITRITLVIGELSSIIDDSVQQYFDVISEGTLAAGAELVFKRLPVNLVCPNCANEFPKIKSNFNCPQCGEMGRIADGAWEFYVESMEVDSG